MKSIFEPETRLGIINRINKLKSDSQANWGKMTVAQMVRHCTLCEEYYFGNIKVSRSFIGRLFGSIALNDMLKDDSTGIKKNAYTSPVFKVTDDVIGFEREKEIWKNLIERYAEFDNSRFTHWFFGKMTKEQLGYFVYKHCDHHLKQFGV